MRKNIVAGNWKMNTPFLKVLLWQKAWMKLLKVKLLTVM